jgi:NADPH:quinone reductase-like Zn-dependent oxidoreductase
MDTSVMMRAAVIYEPGGPEVLKLETIPVPKPKDDEVLIRIKAFGLNRSELFTRQGHSPGVKFPRVLGIEACGLVEEAPGGQFKKNQIVATAMGGMVRKPSPIPKILRDLTSPDINSAQGREFDGGYAEFTCVPAANVQALETKVSWEIIGAVPEMLQTAYGSLFKALRLQKGERLLVRGGTTSVGLAAAAIAKSHGCFVAGSTRRPSPDVESTMRTSGVEQVLTDDGNIAAQVKDAKFDKVLELVGTVSSAGWLVV